MSIQVSNKRVLLPTNVSPILYKVHLTTNFKEFNFKSSIIIDLKINETTNSIILNAQELTIENESIELLINSSKSILKPIKIELNEQATTLSLFFNENIPIGFASLSIKYIGYLNDKMLGFYRAKYTHNGQEKYMATTQFEATDARRALPCWDEPAHKAKFQVTLTVPKDRIALSNMPIENEIDEQFTLNDESMKTIRFSESPIMSTYLLAFVVGHFDFVESRTKRGIVVRVYTLPGKSHMGQFSLEVATRTLDYFEQYFDIEYPLPKCDNIAITEFSAGAMENWGLITYRETALLVDENSALGFKQNVAATVTHELAHQWFGNLVTMQWWKELWLNEGFATFIGTQAVDVLFPEWDIWIQFTTMDWGEAMKLDCLKNSHPIEVEVYDASEINEIFDTISYCKGASVISMIATTLGEENFRNGLRIYLKRFMYSNAVTTDLWQALSESSGRDVQTLMHNWTATTGYPFIELSIATKEHLNKYISGDSDGSGHENENVNDWLFVKQSRFFASGEIDNSSTLWKIPISFRLGFDNNNEQTVIIIVELKEQVIKIENLSKAKWIKANNNQSGVYRIKYSDELANKLHTALEQKSFKGSDRLGIQNDAFALAKAGFQSTTQALDLAKSYSIERNYAVFLDLLYNIADLRVLLQPDEPAAIAAKKFTIQLIANATNELGWDKKIGEDAQIGLLRSLLIGTTGICGHQPTIDEARKRFDALVAGDSNAISNDLLRAVYEIVMAHNRPNDFDSLLSLFRKATNQENRMRVLRCLGRTRDAQTIQRALEFSLSDEVRKQDVFAIYFGTIWSITGRELTWQFLKNNWPKIYQIYGDGYMLLTRIVGVCTEYFSTEEKADEIEAFFNANPCPAAQRTIKQSCETIRLTAAWIKRESRNVADWFLKQQ
eukprot:TRINITY_DN1544_c0_g2_i1.p1 TRINITY_DN1544_c0_g2~~TRINITY_DN1544_c0_g2_i1.p1  ORF type:complete len:897 (+),score=492.54 TRINITY_DN1544_c0_g2_i1:157-2847(+)